MIRLLWVLYRGRPGVIHFQWTPLAAVDMLFIPLFRRIAPIVLTVHDSIPFNYKPSTRLQYLGAVAIMKKFDQLIVHTAAARARLENYGVAGEKINIVPHGLLGPKESAPYTGGGGCVNLLMFGGIKPYKGVDVLLRAIALLPQDARHICRLRVVGVPGMPMEPLFDLANSLGIASQVDFDLRFVPDGEIGTLMESADIQVFPYRVIDASGVLTLAIGVGRTIVASKLGVFDELLRDGIHGALVPPDDPQALAAALYPLIIDGQSRVRAARAVRDLANSIPDWSVIARLTQEVYFRAKFKGATAKFRSAG
jgi:glycosyltransferase involved in cell wall biosynthesis